jgi:hypothetical protein
MTISHLLVQLTESGEAKDNWKSNTVSVCYLIFTIIVLLIPVALGDAVR